MPVKFYDGITPLKMPKGGEWSNIELKAVPRYYTLATERCVIWTDPDDIVYKWRRWNDMLGYLTDGERDYYNSGDFPEDEALQLILDRMSAIAPTIEELSDATIEVGLQTNQNTDDIALCMDAIIMIINGSEEDGEEI